MILIHVTAPFQTGAGERPWAICRMRPLCRHSTSFLRGAASSLRAELRDGPLLEVAVDEQVDPLVIEGNQPSDLLALEQRRAVRPGEVLDQAVPHAHRPVL